jgi:hypothetical protein
VVTISGIDYHFAISFAGVRRPHRTSLNPLFLDLVGQGAEDAWLNYAADEFAKQSAREADGEEYDAEEGHWRSLKRGDE